MPTTTTKAVDWKVPRINDNSISTALYDTEPSKVFEPASLRGLLEPGPASLLCSGDPCTTCGTHSVALSGLGIKVAGLKLVALPPPDVVAGRPGLRFAWVRLNVLVKSAFACCSREISASIVRIISFVFMNPPSRA
jgi:hypothetical protein